MIPMPNSAAVAPTSVQPQAPSGPPQRQSCDRCYRQKLRCIRNKNSSGGVCDRCSSKQAQCVYSFSLPKGRPSLRRLNEEPISTNTTTTGDIEKSPETTRPMSKGRQLSGASKPAKPLVASSETMVPPVLPRPMDTSMDMSMFTWPWPETTSWDEMQPEMAWGGNLNFNRANVEDMLATAHSFEGDASAQEDSDPFSANQSPSTPSSSHTRTFAHGQPGIGNYERLDGSTMSMFPDKHASIVIAQLSQLSVQLSSLRSSSYTLAQAADLSSGRLPNDRHFPLIDSTAFESVATWLAHEQSSANMNAHGSVHIPVDIPNPYPNSGPQLKPQSGPNILRDVFAASHRLMEILRHLQADDIIRHLVMACEALLLEIYAAILTALQLEAYPGDSMNATALGNVRLVVVVQLCAYLIERQHQAVDQCLAPATPQNNNLRSSLPPGAFHLGMADRESLNDVKNQVQQKLAHLRQMLRCT